MRFLESNAKIDLNNSRLASENLEAIGEVLDYAIKEDRGSSSQVIGILKALSFLVREYLENKWTIDPESRWFVRKKKYADWLFPRADGLNMLRSFAYVGDDGDVADHNWFERRANDILTSALKYYVTNGNSHGAIQTLSVLMDHIGNLALNWEIQAADEFGKETFEFAKVLLANPRVPVSERLMVAEMISMIPVSITMSIFSVAIEKNYHWDCSSLAEETIAGKTSARSKRSPLRVRQLISEFRKRFRIEKELEGKVVTAPWFIRGELERLYSLALADVCLVFTPKKIWALLPFDTFDQEKYDPKIITLNRIRLLELSKRMDKHVEATKKEIEFTNEKLDSLNKNKDLIKKLAALVGDYSVLHDECINDIAECLSGTYDPKRAEGEPDYFGLGLQFVLDGLFVAVMERNSTNMNKLLPKAITAAENARARVVALAVDSVYRESTYKMALEPFVDLLFVSGAVYILSEIDRKPEFKKEVLDTWLNLIQGANDLEKIQNLLALYSGYKSIHVVADPQMRRFNWNKDLEDVLHENGIEKKSIYDDPFVSRRRSSKKEPSRGRLLDAVKLALPSGIDLAEVFLVAAIEDLGGTIPEDDRNLQFSHFWHEATEKPDA